MIIELIAIFLFAVSVIGIAAIILQKIPVLAELPIQGRKKKGILAKAKENIKNREVFKFFAPEVILQKALSKFRVFVLKIERKVNDWLIALRQKKLEKNTNNNPSEEYWNKLKNASWGKLTAGKKKKR